MRGDVLTRAFICMRILKGGWRTLKELSDATGTCRRTVFRYLAAMEAAGLPLTQDRGGSHEPSRYRLL